ncbi:MAG TPA: fatty acid--CoA ligase family protein [Steroidobacteraceae bacterium]|jgi:acyl-coenzyme A synthetase/AMP-(fatty) acid ligase|nr:fatty acid--CoA ligase family protein [Steroidobacteraceae bacterium]
MWLWEWICADTAAPALGPQLFSGEHCVSLRSLARQSLLQTPLARLRGRSVLLSTADALSGALALLELDGVARRVLLCPPDVRQEHLPALAATAQIDAAVGNLAPELLQGLGIVLSVAVDPAAPQPLAEARAPWHQTEWILLTSGTSGPPKLVEHSMETLTQAFADDALPAMPDPERLWSSFYDPRRYGGLQILLRSLRSRGMLLLNPAQPLPAFLAQAAALGVTHISGTASHWRALLMSGAAATLQPRYVRLSGEIADQAVLDALHAAWPDAQIAHAFASTEAGVAFEVQDGLAGFPAAWIDAPRAVALRIRDGRLQVRSSGTGVRYLGADSPALRDAEGYVDTGDRVQLHGDRYAFLGRSGGIINVGGMKVHPEEVEAVINSQPFVQMSRVRARRSPITGALVAAEVVLHPAAAAEAATQITAQIREACRRALAPHKVPAVIQIVYALPLSANGKLLRGDA